MIDEREVGAHSDSPVASSIRSDHSPASRSSSFRAQNPYGRAKALVAELRDLARQPSPIGRNPIPAWLKQNLEAAADALEAADAERADAYRAGAEAMREAAAKACAARAEYYNSDDDAPDSRRTRACRNCESVVRALPPPTMPAPAGEGDSNG